MGARPRGRFCLTRNSPSPELRERQGERVGARLLNGLDEPTTIHWHGIRLPNAMDGVPFLTQPYVYKGDVFDYAFTPPDAGTYWYQPQLAVSDGPRPGGLLIVEEVRDPGYDADIALNPRDWPLRPDGQLLSLFVLRQWARAGTSGTVRTANWLQAPTYDSPNGGLVRPRLAATVVTHIYRPAIEGADALVIALDGNPLARPRSPNGEMLAPGQRTDLVIRMPDGEGQTVDLRDLTTQIAAPLSRLRAVGSSRRRDLRDAAPLPANPIVEPELSAAAEIEFDLTATAEQVARSAVYGDLGYSFWAIRAGPGTARITDAEWTPSPAASRTSAAGTAIARSASSCLRRASSDGLPARRSAVNFLPMEDVVATGRARGHGPMTRSVLWMRTQLYQTV
ncbi:MAG: multicopper oxidase family protein [Hyphomicrobiaceae bacterium]|nr:multicopper oxidase family protein [Hyphomicrobiaceae bacterium]